MQVELLSTLRKEIDDLCCVVVTAGIMTLVILEIKYKTYLCKIPKNKFSC